ncbi:hypothetical protein Tco_0739109 [Tanacetum coccineum]
MKHWKGGFFFIDRQAIPDAKVWRHTNTAIDDPSPDDGSFNMADVRRLSAHVIKLRDIPEGMEMTGVEVQEEPHLDVRSTLQRLPFYCTPPAAADVVILDPTLNDLVASTPSSNIVAKDEASQKRKASTSSATLSHVANCTRSALAQSSGSTTRPSLFVGDDDEIDDACVEITLITPLHSAAVIPSLGNQGRSFAAPTAEGSNPQELERESGRKDVFSSELGRRTPPIPHTSLTHLKVYQLKLIFRPGPIPIH